MPRHQQRTAPVKALISASRQVHNEAWNIVLKLTRRADFWSWAEFDEFCAYFGAYGKLSQLHVLHLDVTYLDMMLLPGEDDHCG